MGYVREYRPGDEIYIAHCLRQADRQELQALSDRTSVEILREGAMNSTPSCTVIGNYGLGAGLFGAIDEGSGSGRIWLMGTDELTSPGMRNQFIRECRIYVKGMERRYKVLHNHIDERNTIHIRWLSWLGFTLINRVPEYGVQRRPFLEFIKLCANQSQ